MRKKPILLDLPMPIQTARLLLRPLMPGDGKQVFEAVEESREQFKLWLPWTNEAHTWEDCECTAREFYAGFIVRKSVHLVILKDSELMGMCGFNHIDWNIPSATIGYWCRKSAQGNGYMREAVEALTNYGFNTLQFKKLSILCDDRNLPSIRVAERAGYTLEVRAKGLLPDLQNGNNLAYGRRYVKFN